MPKHVFLLAFLLLNVPVFGQGIGVWQFHGAYSNTKTVAKAGGTLFVAGDYSAYQFEHSTGEMDDFTRLDGLSDNAYSRLAYNEPEQTLIVAYSTGNIDLAKNGQVENIPALLNANIIGSRRINHISFNGSIAYLSCDFGIVVLDLSRREIRASNTSLDASSANSPILVKASDAKGDSLFLATSKGIMAIARNRNLMDSRQFHRWDSNPGVTGLPLDVDKLVTVFRYGSRTYAGYSAPHGFYFLGDDGKWAQDPTFLPAGGLRSVTVMGDQLLACIDNAVYIKHGPGQQAFALADTLVVEPQEAVFGENNTVYVADKATGLTRIALTTPAGFQAFRPNGPSIDLPFKIYAKGSRLYVLSGGYETSTYTQLDNRGGYSVFENGFWSNFNRFNNSFPDQAVDIVSAHEDASGLYLASYGNGLIFKPFNSERYRFYSDSAGLPNTLINAVPAVEGRFVRVTDVETDSRGNRWVLNHTADQSLHRWTNDGWTAYTLTPSNRAQPVELLIDESNVKWIRMAPERSSGGSVIGFRESATGNLEGVITNQRGRGGLPSNAVYDYAIDQEGIMWLGTGAGLAALYSPSVVFGTDPFDVTLPIFDGRPLLENDIVSAIAIDGGGRKWVGTRNSGLWLFDKEVTRVLANYTFGNSPLPSNNITDLAIAGQSGQLFISTDRGLLSLRIDATNVDEGTAPSDNCVRIFPNPVRPDFQGLIGIECLPENAVVKITDQANRLVYETRANGGTATWNGKNYNGRKAAAGVYYVYAVTQGQRSGVVGRIAIVR